MIKHHKEDNNTQEFKPNFNDVKPQDVNEIFFQILENVHKFNKNVFFQGLQPKMLWKDFYDNMTKRIYNKGEVIYERGQISAEFFVINKGKVWFLLKEEDIEKSDLEGKNNQENGNKLYSLFLDKDLNFKSKEKLQEEDHFKVQLENSKNKSMLKKGEEKTNFEYNYQDGANKEIVVKNLPFMEVDSYFGEFELFDDSTRRWTVVAESNCILYTIPKNIFFDLLLDEKRQHTFLLELRDRLSNFLLAEQETLKNIKKMEMSSQEVIEKFEKFENQNKVINQFDELQKESQPVQSISIFQGPTYPKKIKSLEKQILQ